MMLTPGDRRGYKDGAFDRIKPARPITEGGIGAIQVNARYDHLDLNDAGLVGGRQQAALLSLVWAPIDYIRLTANHGRLWIDDARVATTTGDRDYPAGIFGFRTQVGFGHFHSLQARRIHVGVFKLRSRRHRERRRK